MTPGTIAIVFVVLVVAPVAFWWAMRLKKDFEREVEGRQWAWYGRWSIKSDDPEVWVAFRRYVRRGIPLIVAVLAAMFTAFWLAERAEKLDANAAKVRVFVEEAVA